MVLADGAGENDMEKYKQLAKYLRGTAEALDALAGEIIEAKGFDKESEELMSKIGSNLLFHAKTYDYLEEKRTKV